ncbi:Hypothetical protein R9X50_00466600 [Acrodontium crateriforme]|uniref:Uncharacterized protein n=1 Tax=Acrodontium crateriforme TaxID=150365 RepID=A0AAQ3M4P3_9PEZI|nr:Hypothetical protein R9X50_00466600 [Acrodontium crateriforme]
MLDELERHSTITNHASYLADVLNLTENQVEDDLDRRLRMEAKDLGLDAEGYMQTLRPQSAAQPYMTDIRRRSQESSYSRASHSTGLTSNFSDVSKENHGNGGPRLRASLSIRDYDAFLARGTPDGQHFLSFSLPTTPSQSTFSLPLSSPITSPKKHFRRIRGLSLLRLNRNTSSSSLPERCPHCARDPISQRRAVHKLPCGHRLCTLALRSTIATATQGETGAVPSCCGIPIPGNLIEHVMTLAEQEIFLERVEQWDDMASNAPSSRRDSVATGLPMSSIRPEFHHSPARDSDADSLLPKMGKDLDHVLDLPEFRILRQQQGDLLDRFVAWTEQRRSNLDRQNQETRRELKTRHELDVEAMMDHHLTVLADAEDKQVKAEADLREFQEQELRDNATALKHMEAYCAGTYSTGDPHHRLVTEQDRIELEKRRGIRAVLETKHANGINVLRGEQSRRMRSREHRQAKELQDLLRAHQVEEHHLEQAFAQSFLLLDEEIAEKKMRIRARWQLQIAIFIKRLEIGSVRDDVLSSVFGNTAFRLEFGYGGV